MTNNEYVRKLLAPYGPTLPLDALVEELNRIYHSFEAHTYDVRHPEVHQQLPPVWAEMIEIARRWQPRRTFRILDFGCGTGFEALQVLRNLTADRIACLTCYDPSQEMLDRCRDTLVSAGVTVRFAGTAGQLIGLEGKYDLIVTNSLLHHLPQPAAALCSIHQLMDRDAIWLSGHEPSARFFRNSECYAGFREYDKQVFKRKLLSPASYLRSARSIIGMDGSPASATASASFRNGLFRRRPPRSLIGKVVDYHVPHSPDEAHAGRGFDFHQLQVAFQNLWRLEWIKSYAFLGPYLETSLAPEWEARTRSLASKYPFDGANFCAVWRRV